jgi:hypothetical protein
MSLRESLDKYLNQSPDLCPTARLRNKLSPEDQEVLDSAFEKNVAIYSIARALRAEGHRIAEATVSDHHKKVCRCYKN